MVWGEKAYPQGGLSVYKTFGLSSGRLYLYRAKRGLRSYVGATPRGCPVEGER